MKRIKFVFLLPLVLVACKSTPVVEETKEEEQPVVETPVEEEPQVVEVEEEIVVEVEDNEEYLRSITDLSEDEVVSKDEFEEDKKQILEIIDDLKLIMEREDTKGWLSYLDPASITYYSNPTNIRKAQKKLPDKTLQLHGIGDYFKHVFIPSRKRSQVDEIRYISKTNVKAVQVKSDNSIVIYYYFVKIDGNWLIHIPEL